MGSSRALFPSRLLLAPILCSADSGLRSQNRLSPCTPSPNTGLLVQGSRPARVPVRAPFVVDGGKTQTLNMSVKYASALMDSSIVFYRVQDN